MKKRLRLVAVVALLCGLASAGFGFWSYVRSRTLAAASRSLQETSLELEDRSDSVKGTPEEGRLVSEAQRYENEASDTLAGAKAHSQRAVIFGVASVVLILASIGMIVAHVRKKEGDGS
ncbi:MAG: hypothetical protein QOJ64_3282 [Acidobacteriota bacterium]|jgi:hypothetical protein|nr:hypothetical protein [Acidobacteriota bacterium]